MSFPIEFSPVDSCAKFILALLHHRTQNLEVYHLFNQNYLYFSDLFDKLENENIHIQIVESEIFKKKLLECPETYFGITNYVKNFSKNNINLVHLENDFTNKILKENHLEWPKINDIYIGKIIHYLKNNNLIGGIL